MVSTHLKNIIQIGNLPQKGVKIKNIWNHDLVFHWTMILGGRGSSISILRFCLRFCFEQLTYMRNIFPKLVVENGEIKYGRIRKRSPKKQSQDWYLAIGVTYIMEFPGFSCKHIQEGNHLHSQLFFIASHLLWPLRKDVFKDHIIFQSTARQGRCCRAHPPKCLRKNVCFQIRGHPKHTVHCWWFRNPASHLGCKKLEKTMWIMG